MTGEDALAGKDELIEGHHTFTVGDQSKVVGNGVLIAIFPPGQTSAIWQGNTTGSEGKSVSTGYEVKVLKATVKFT
jgi:hypothetical protein